MVITRNIFNTGMIVDLQSCRSVEFFVQSFVQFNFTDGIRADKHNAVDEFGLKKNKEKKPSPLY